ncbi:MAG TPA: lipocalin family protein, partial [Gemmatimonadales bacterium]
MRVGLALVAALLAAQDSVSTSVRSVPAVDLERYAGLWHEVARFPNAFQERCSTETTAWYELLPGGELRVVNSCRRADGRIIRAEGRARPADREGP